MFIQLLVSIRNKNCKYTTETSIYNKLSRTKYDDDYSRSTIMAMTKFDALVLHTLNLSFDLDMINRVIYCNSLSNIKKRYLSLISLPWSNNIRIKLAQYYSQIKF